MGSALLIGVGYLALIGAAGWWGVAAIVVHVLIMAIAAGRRKP